MADNNITIYQQAPEGLTGNYSPIIIPEINNPSWQIPAYVMTTIATGCQFHGRENEDAMTHVSRLNRIVKTFNMQGATRDAIYTQLFPFSLTGWAATWLDTQPSDTCTTWKTLRSAFIKKYFSPAKASHLRDQIHSFHMEPGELYYQAWERFQNFLSRCSNHGLTSCALMEKLFNSLNFETRARFDKTAGCNIME